MPRQNKQHTKQFKLDAINYRKEHPDLTQSKCAKTLGIGISTLGKWEAQFRNRESDEQKEIARLKRKLRDLQDVLDALKSHRHSGKKLTEAIYTEVSTKVESYKVTGRRVSTSGILNFLGVSRSGYRAFLNHKIPPSCQHKKAVKKSHPKDLR